MIYDEAPAEQVQYYIAYVGQRIRGLGLLHGHVLMQFDDEPIGYSTILGWRHSIQADRGLDWVQITWWQKMDVVQLGHVQEDD